MANSVRKRNVSGSSRKRSKFDKDWTLPGSSNSSKSSSSGNSKPSSPKVQKSILKDRSKTHNYLESLSSDRVYGSQLPKSAHLNSQNGGPQFTFENNQPESRFTNKHWVSKKCHKPNISLISSGSGWSDYTGFLNLSILLLVLSNARVFIENLRVFGVRVDPHSWYDAIFQIHTFPNILIIVLGFASSYVAVFIEKLVVQGKISVENRNGGTVPGLQILNMLVYLVYSTGSVMINDLSPATSIPALSWVIIVELKLWSYAQTNSWYRAAWQEKSQDSIKNGNKKSRRTQSLTNLEHFAKEKESEGNQDIYEYPMNIRYRNMWFFMMLPTLCYEINFPRNEKIRIVFLLRRLVEVFILLQIMLALIQQWIVPSLEEAVVKMVEKDAVFTIEQTLRLVLPNLIIWLLGFYMVFHSFLNFLAEIFKFADREFYRDWWNAKDIISFWQLWNIPVHKWCLRHLYKPLLRSGYSKMTANLLVFTFSAIFHEYALSVPMKMLRFYAFSGMFLQVPLALISSFVFKKFGKTYSNTIVWLSLIAGQPIACLLYVFDHYNSCNTIKYYLS